jgi:hypothetical protein
MVKFYIKTKYKNARPMIISGIIATTLILFGCGDDKSTNPDTTLQYPATGLRWSEHIQPIFFRSCAFSSCHDAVSKAGGLDLQTEPVSFISNSGLVVVPFSRTQSLLYEVLFTSTQNIRRMPPNRARLSDVEIEAIGQWIDEGALPN